MCGCVGVWVGVGGCVWVGVQGTKVQVFNIRLITKSIIVSHCHRHNTKLYRAVSNRFVIDHLISSKVNININDKIISIPVHITKWRHLIVGGEGNGW